MPATAQNSFQSDNIKWITQHEAELQKLPGLDIERMKKYTDFENIRALIYDMTKDGKYAVINAPIFAKYSTAAKNFGQSVQAGRAP